MAQSGNGAPSRHTNSHWGVSEAGEHSWVPPCFQLALAISRAEIPLESSPWVLGSFTLSFIQVP